MTLAVTVSFMALAQNDRAGIDKTRNAQTYSDRYDLLVSKLGPSGVGVETVLDQWEKVDSADAKMLKAKYVYYLNKSRSTRVVTKENPSYLGLKPILSLKDSLDVTHYYFEEPVYDEELLGKALKALDRGIRYYPEDLDFRFSKSAVLMDYEKESPDMTLQLLENLVELNEASSYTWKMADVENPDKEFVNTALQEYCYSFYKIGSAQALEAFRSLSEKVLQYEPKNAVFLGNLGSYYQRQGDIRKAVKYYNKVLKIDESNYAAIKNMIAIAVAKKDKKTQKKILPLLIKYGTETDKLQAQARLDVINK